MYDSGLPWVHLSTDVCVFECFVYRPEGEMNSGSEWVLKIGVITHLDPSSTEKYTFFVFSWLAKTRTRKVPTLKGPRTIHLNKSCAYVACSTTYNSAYRPFAIVDHSADVCVRVDSTHTLGWYGFVDKGIVLYCSKEYLLLTAGLNFRATQVQSFRLCEALSDEDLPCQDSSSCVRFGTERVHVGYAWRINNLVITSDAAQCSAAVLLEKRRKSPRKGNTKNLYWRKEFQNSRQKRDMMIR